MSLIQIIIHPIMYYNQSKIRYTMSLHYKNKTWIILSCCFLVILGLGICATKSSWNHTNKIAQLESNPQLQLKLREKRFVKHFAPYAIKASKKPSQNVIPSLTIAQAGEESNWGHSSLYTKGRNPYGIKGAFYGKSINYPTKEMVHGRYMSVNAKFKKYPNLQRATADHNYLLRKLFLKGVSNQNSYTQDAKALETNHYATDPSYADNLIYIIKNLHLTKYDK